MLSETMFEAANEVLSLEAEERMLLKDGLSGALARVLLRLPIARDKWHKARAAYHGHVREHGC